MRRSFERLFLVLALLLPLAMPAIVTADTLSVSQVITITATVPPMRSIVVNDYGQMTMIYSNTDKNVTPKVYLDKVPGKQLPLTPALRSQYNAILAKQKQLIGVSIPVIQSALAQRNDISKLFSNTISSLLK